MLRLSVILSVILAASAASANFPVYQDVWWANNGIIQIEDEFPDVAEWNGILYNFSTLRGYTDFGDMLQSIVDYPEIHDGSGLDRLEATENVAFLLDQMEGQQR